MSVLIGKEETTALQKAIDKFNESKKFKSYAERNPELGKMINCAVCGRRHRSIQKCEPHYIVKVENEVPNSFYAKKRFHPHLNKKTMLFTEVVRRFYKKILKNDILPFDREPDQDTLDRVLSQARHAAYKCIDVINNKRQKFLRKQQDCATRINRGLLHKGARP